jgi:hypothetical protein
VPPDRPSQSSISGVVIETAAARTIGQSDARRFLYQDRSLLSISSRCSRIAAFDRNEMLYFFDPEKLSVSQSHDFKSLFGTRSICTRFEGN